jgi:hypothetical protein
MLVSSSSFKTAMLALNSYHRWLLLVVAVVVASLPPQPLEIYKLAFMMQQAMSGSLLHPKCEMNVASLRQELVAFPLGSVEHHVSIFISGGSSSCQPDSGWRLSTTFCWQSGKLWARNISRSKDRTAQLIIECLHILYSTFIYTFSYWWALSLRLRPPYKKVKPSAVTTLKPTTDQPVWMTCLFVKVLPVSQAKCLNPLKLWKVKGNAKNALSPTFAMIGSDAKLAARLADSRCQPKRGAARYAAPKA